MGVNIRVSNAPLYTGLNDCGLASDVTRKFKCDCCGETVEVPVTYIHIKSDFDKSEFCSHNCRCKYYKEHAAEREKYLYEHSPEGKGHKARETAKRHTEESKRRYHEDEEYRNLINERAKKWNKAGKKKEN